MIFFLENIQISVEKMIINNDVFENMVFCADKMTVDENGLQSLIEAECPPLPDELRTHIHARAKKFAADLSSATGKKKSKRGRPAKKSEFCSIEKPKKSGGRRNFVPFEQMNDKQKKKFVSNKEVKIRSGKELSPEENETMDKILTEIKEKNQVPYETQNGAQ